MTALLRPLRLVLLSTLAAAGAITAPVQAQRQDPAILIVGDSVSAGYGLPANTGWATLLQQRLSAQRYRYRAINASITGDTTAGGRARLAALLTTYRPEIVIIELGGNDGLRGGNLGAMHANLDAMTLAAQKSGARVLLIGMQLPPNYGPTYVERFGAAFGEVAKARNTALVPFLFDGFADDDAMFQPDRIHPVLAAQSKMLDNVWPYLLPLLRAAKKAA